MPNEKGIGRPSSYTEEIGNEICERLAGGESLRSICREMSITGIYGLACPKSGRVRYVGQAKNIAIRYSKHLRSFGGTPKDYWIDSLRKKGVSPRLIVLEETDHLDDREEHWVREYGLKNLLNVSSGGSDVSHWRDSKDLMPWSGKRAPFQSAISSIRSNVKALRESGHHESAEIMEDRADECARASKKLQMRGPKVWVAANMALLCSVPSLMAEYQGCLDTSKASRAMGVCNG